MISSRGNLSYGEILKKVKSLPDLKDLDGNVSNIRRIQKGDLVFVLKKSNLGFTSQVRKSLGENVAVWDQKHEVYYICNAMISTK